MALGVVDITFIELHRIILYYKFTHDITHIIINT